MYALSRRTILGMILKTLSVLLMERPLLLKAFGGLRLPTRALKGKAIGEHFSGESLYYRIGFWWFKDAARGKIAFEKKGEGRYMATVEAETLGIIGWLTRYRKDIYHTYMEEMEGGRRLRTYLIEKEINIGGRIRKGYTGVDYKRRVVEWRSWGGGNRKRGGGTLSLKGSSSMTLLWPFTTSGTEPTDPLKREGSIGFPPFPRMGRSSGSP